MNTDHNDEVFESKIEKLAREAEENIEKALMEYSPFDYLYRNYKDEYEDYKDEAIQELKSR